MRISVFAIAVAVLIAAPSSNAQDFSSFHSREQRLALTFGFLVGQETSLQLVESTFPDLRGQVARARSAFNSSGLGGSFHAVDSQLRKLAGSRWIPTRKRVISEIQEKTWDHPLTREQATNFLLEVNLRAAGGLPDPILNTLLTTNPRFLETPELEVLSGWKQAYRTWGIGKAKGLDFSISFPATWVGRNSDASDLVQVFQSNAGHGPVRCNLMVLDLTASDSETVTSEQIEELFQVENLQAMVPEGADFVSGKIILLAGAPAAMLITERRGRLSQDDPASIVTQFATVHGRSMVLVQFIVMDQGVPYHSLTPIQSKYLKTFEQIAGSLTFDAEVKF